MTGKDVSNTLFSEHKEYAINSDDVFLLLECAQVAN